VVIAEVAWVTEFGVFGLMVVALQSKAAPSLPSVVVTEVARPHLKRACI